MLQVAFSIVAVAVALIGVVMQNNALHYAELGEAPDLGGSAEWAGVPGSASEIEKQFHIDLRAHYRRAASTLSIEANYVLLVSVLAGVLSGWTANLTIAVVCGLFLVVAILLVFRFALPRPSTLKAREADLERRRTEYNKSNFDAMAARMGDEYATAGFRPIEPFEHVRW